MHLKSQVGIKKQIELSSYLEMDIMKKFFVELHLECHHLHSFKLIPLCLKLCCRKLRILLRLMVKPHFWIYVVVQVLLGFVSARLVARKLWESS